MLEKPLLFIAQAFSFLITLFSRTQSVRPHLVASSPSLCRYFVTYGALCHSIGHQVLPTQPLPTEAEGFPRGGKCFDHVALFT